MKTITINSTNATREFEASDLDTVNTILDHAETRKFFGFDEYNKDEAYSVLVGHVTSIVNGNDRFDLTSMSEGFKKAILNAALEDGAVINIDYFSAEDNNGNQIDQDADDDDDDEHDDVFDDDDDDTGDQDNTAPAAAAPQETLAGDIRHGIVKVTTNGGMVSTNVEIIDGKTTVQDAIYSQLVQARSGMDETAISNCMILLDGDTVTPNHIATRVLHSGDTIDLTPRFAASKGLAD